MADIQKIKGFVDLFPSESDKFTFLEQTARTVFSRYGFGELRTPILEKTELFCRSIGEETDVVQKEMYTFLDRKDRSLTMRPEATAGVARAFIESGLWQPGLISRLYSLGPMFRYERPQKGRQRQFHQVNAELIGPVEPQADAEVILMLDAFLKAIGLQKLTVELNSLGCPECRPVFKHALKEFFAGIDAAGLCEDCRRRAGTNPLRVLDCKVPGCKALTKDAPSILDHLCDHCVPHFETVKTVLTRAGLPFTLNPRLVRGLDYYQRTTFEITSADIGAQASVAGGGRYDGLFKALGGPDIPAVGFACGMERLALLLGQMERPRPDFFVAVLDERAEDAAVLLAQTLREAGFSGEVSYKAGSMKSRLRQADKSRARNGLILGESEIAASQVTIKNMTVAGEQKTVPWAQVIENLY